MRQVSAAVLLGMQLFISGCDTMHSLSRTVATTAPMPCSDEVTPALRRVLGVTAVESVLVPAHTYIALAYGPMKTLPYFRYLVSSENALVVLTIGGAQGYGVGLSALWQNHQPSDTERQAAAALMDAIYDALAARFPSFPSKTEFKESRDGAPTQIAALGRGQ